MASPTLEKTYAYGDDKQAPSAPAVPASTIYKLLFFTVAMFSLPLAAYFGSVNLVFGGNATWAGALAALVANLVLFGYVIAAVREDAGEQASLKQGVGKIE